MGINVGEEQCLLWGSLQGSTGPDQRFKGGASRAFDLKRIPGAIEWALGALGLVQFEFGSVQAVQDPWKLFL